MRSEAAAVRGQGRCTSQRVALGGRRTSALSTRLRFATAIRRNSFRKAASTAPGGPRNAAFSESEPWQ